MKLRLSMLLVAVATTSVLAASDNRDSHIRTIQAEVESIDKAIVMLDGNPLFQVRGMSGFSASQRAHAISARIETAAADSVIPSTSVSIIPMPDISQLVIKDTVVARLLDTDAALEGIPRAILAEQARLNIIRAIDSYRHDRSPPILLRRTALAIGVTALTILLLLGIRRLFRSILTAAEQHLKTRMETLETHSAKAVEARPLWVAVLGIVNAFRTALTALIAYFYLNLVLGLFPWTHALAARLFSVFVDPLHLLATKLIDMIPDLVFLLILWLVVRYILKITRLFFSGIERGSIVFENFEQDWAAPTYKIVRILIACFALVVAYPYIPGSNSDAFKGVSLFVGVLFSLGSTSFIANMIAGLALTYRRAFRIGDVIKMNEAMGVVTDMRLQATHIRTNKNEAIVIPNSELVNNHVINYSTLAKGMGLVLHTSVGIGYETPWRQVEAMLLMAAERTPGLQKDRKAFVLQRALGDFSINYELNAYCNAPLTMLTVYNELHKNILDVFNEYGVQIMTPAYEGDPDQPKIVPKNQWHAAPAPGDPKS